MPLVLDSLEIKNFRAFRHLRIEKLGRVNLIVGKNNVGKSSVLEALWLYILRGEPAVINQILWDKDEMLLPKDRDARRGIFDAKERGVALNSLFYGRIDTRQNHEPISIGAVDSADNCVLIDVAASDAGSHIPQISVTIGTKAPAILDTQNYRWGLFAFPPDLETNKCTFIPADGLNSADVGTFWDQIALSDLETEVIAALKIVYSDVEAINLVGNEGKEGERTAKVRVHGMSQPVSLRSLGDGMNRMLRIALALVNAKDGMLLIDEVDRRRPAMRTKKACLFV